MTESYRRDAAKRAVNLSLNEDLVAKVRALTPNLSAEVERLLAEFLAGEQARRAEADQSLTQALAAWSEFDAAGPSFADEYSTL